jgi:hypothetical protein
MIITRQIIDSTEVELLSSLVSATWVDISGDGLTDKDLCWESVRIETSAKSIELSFALEVIDIAGEDDDYPCLHIREADEKSSSAQKNGRIFYHCKGQLIEQVWVLRVTLTNFRHGEKFFENTADVSVAFNCGDIWLSFTRAAHFSDVINIQRTGSINEIEIPDVLDEWEVDLTNQFEISQEWICIGSN